MRLLQAFIYGATLVLLGLHSGPHGTLASRILLLAPITGKSHKQFYTALATTLAKHGHEMTLVSPYPPIEDFPGVREIVLPNLSLLPHAPNLFEGTLIQRDMTKICAELCADGLQDPQVVQLFDEKFDMIMIQAAWTECFLVFQHHLKVPLVFVTPGLMEHPGDNWFGNPLFPSYDVNILVDAQPPLSFWMRLVNIFKNLRLYATFHYKTLNLIEGVSRSRGLLPEDILPLENLIRNASLLILNSYRVLESPKPLVSNIIHAGGLHLRPAQPLSQDLEAWVQGAGEHGFIYFSLGSFTKTADMPEKYLSVLMRTFKRLQQKVLMKWNEDHIEGLSPNVRLGKWLPQQDILAHPKLRLFISHGGLNSVQEALNHGVPILGMPLYFDQMFNMRKGAHQGWAVRLDWSELTEEALMSTINKALNDTRVRDQAQKMSALIKDQPMAPEETVVYWVEYVLRHGGANHLRCPAADMNWFILYNCDVWITIVISFCVTVYAFFAMVRCLLRRCCVSGTKKKTE